MGRTEYYDDPDAPTPNSLVPAATVVVQDERGRVLMVQRSDNGLWALPGGAMEVGETLGQCAKREVLEETGYEIKVIDVIGVYSDPKHVIEYSDGEVRQQFAVSFRGLLVAGTAATSAETPQVGWVGEAELDELPMHPSTRLRIQHGLEPRPRAYLG
jgi:8-oxo-dGTP pyrophosphatase MutT (NUDIX family)